MPSTAPNTSRDNFDADKPYAFVSQQQGMPIFDADLNEQARRHHLIGALSLVLTGLHNAGPGVSGYTRLEGGMVNNSFLYQVAGAVPFHGPHPHRGLMAMLFPLLALGTGPTAVEYEDATSANMNYLCAGIVTGVNGGANQITDGNKLFKTEHYLDAMGGFRVLMLTGAEAGNVFTISAFLVGGGTLTLTGGIGGILAGDRFRILPPALTTPAGADRTDDVYLMMAGFNVNTEVDTDIEDPTTGLEGSNKTERICILVVDQGQTGVFASEAMLTSNDLLDPLRVQFALISTISRLDGNATITSPMIADSADNLLPFNQLARAFGIDHSLSNGQTWDADNGKHTQITALPGTGLPVYIPDNTADSYVTITNNGSGSHQGNLRMTDGVYVFHSSAVFHFRSLDTTVRHYYGDGTANVLTEWISGATNKRADVRTYGRFEAYSEFRYVSTRTSYKLLQAREFFGMVQMTADSTLGNCSYDKVGAPYIYDDTANSVTVFYVPVDLFSPEFATLGGTPDPSLLSITNWGIRGGSYHADSSVEMTLVGMDNGAAAPAGETALGLADAALLGNTGTTTNEQAGTLSIPLRSKTTKWYFKVTLTNGPSGNQARIEAMWATFSYLTPIGCGS